MSIAVNLAPIGLLARVLVHAALPEEPVIHSVDALARMAGLSRRALQYRCQAAGVTARDCVRFVQCLKAIIGAAGAKWEPAAVIPIADARTLRRLLTQAGMENNSCPTISEFIPGQQFLQSVGFREAVLRELEALSRTAA